MRYSGDWKNSLASWDETHLKLLWAQSSACNLDNFHNHFNRLQDGGCSARSFEACIMSKAGFGAALRFAELRSKRGGRPAVRTCETSHRIQLLSTLLWNALIQHHGFHVKTQLVCCIWVFQFFAFQWFSDMQISTPSEVGPYKTWQCRAQRVRSVPLEYRDLGCLRWVNISARSGMVAAKSSWNWLSTCISWRNALTSCKVAVTANNPALRQTFESHIGIAAKAEYGLWHMWPSTQYAMNCIVVHYAWHLLTLDGGNLAERRFDKGVTWSERTWKDTEETHSHDMLKDPKETKDSPSFFWLVASNPQEERAGDCWQSYRSEWRLRGFLPLNFRSRRPRDFN